MVYTPEYHWHKSPTHLTIYAEDMLNHVRSSPRDKEHFRLSMSLLEDRAHGSLFLFPMKIVEQVLKASPVVAYTNLADIDLSHIDAPTPTVLKNFPFYQQIKQLLKIIAISNDLLDDLKEGLRISRAPLHELSEVICDFYDWAFETYPRHELKSEDNCLVKPAEKNIEWFAMLCDQFGVDDKMSARSLWNKIKSNSASEKPICFDIYQVVIHGDALFYSELPMTPKEWKEYINHEEAGKIIFKTFENYLSRYKKNIPNNPTRDVSVS